MGGREALVHLGVELAAQAIDAFKRRRHTFRNTADVMPEILGDDVEMTASLECRRPHLLAQPSDLLAQPSDLLMQPSDLLVQPSDVLVQPSDLLVQPTDLLAQLTDLLAESPEGLIEVGASLVVHGITLVVRPRPFQVCRPRYTTCRHMWAITSISTRAPAGSLAAWTVERAGGCFPAWRAYTSFISAKSSMRARNTVVLTR